MLPSMTQTTIDRYVSRVPFDAERVGAAAVYCSDGRYGDQMDEFLHEALGLPRYDRVAAPGGCGCLAGHSIAIREQGAMEKQLRFLIAAHDLDRIVFIAHHDCGFYKQLKLWGKTIEEQQRIDMAKTAQIVCGVPRKAGRRQGAVRAGRPLAHLFT